MNMKKETKTHILFWMVTLGTFALVVLLSKAMFDRWGMYAFPMVMIMYFAGAKLSAEFVS